MQFPIQNCVHFVIVHLQTFLSDLMSKEVHFRHPKFAFYELGIQLIFPQSLEHLPEVLHMFFQGATIDQNVVYVDDDDKVIKSFLGNVIHESAKCGGCVSEPKRHHQEFV
jgi:hypothetical protein